MNPNTATNEELRDWLANHQPMLPIPNTIDAAAKCLPGGWKLYRMAEPASGAFGWSAVRKMVKVGVLATNDEATDRFRLAVKAIMAMEEGK